MLLGILSNEGTTPLGYFCMVISLGRSKESKEFVIMQKQEEE